MALTATVVSVRTFLSTHVIYFRCLIFVAVAALAWFTPRLGDPWISRIERLGRRFAQKKWTTVLSIGVAAILTRLALLPVMPVPVPDTHDEFSHLLAADTFVHGRLTNPPHPLVVFFDTFHVLQRPSYQSMYPPAQAAVLAAGQLLGHPWIGVLLSMAIMCAAIAWMLQGWLPAEWALLGGVLVILRIHLFSYWLEGYWGGAVPAIGGALVVGALPRIVRKQRAIDAAFMGIGLALLSNSRPFEGAIFAATVAAALVAWAFSKRAPSLIVTFRRILLPIMLVMIPVLAFMGYYNWRVTGNAFLFPEQLLGQQHTSVSPFIWKSSSLAPFWHVQSIATHSYSNPQFDDYYNGLAQEASQASAVRVSLQKAKGWQEFFLGSVLWIALLGLPWLFKDRRTRFLLVQFAVCAFGCLIIYWFNPHYTAPFAATGIALLVQSIRHLRRWEYMDRPIGIFLTRLILALVIARVAVYVYRPPAMKMPWSWSRAQIGLQLRNTPGNHLVVVRYAPEHDPNDEWVYNEADIDHSKVVWAREIPGVDLKPLLDYFRDRKIWLLEADATPPKLRAFRPKDAASGTLSASGSNEIGGPQ